MKTINFTITGCKTKQKAKRIRKKKNKQNQNKPKSNYTAIFNFKPIDRYRTWNNEGQI